MYFHEKLMELRKAKGLSQEELGYRLGVTRQTVSKWETGQTTPEMDKLIELSLLFGLPLVHINIGHGMRRAKGVIAFGTVATGVISFGAVSVGVLSFGALSVGLLALGGLALGLGAVGGIAAGLLAAAGGLSFGGLAFGGLAVGKWALGGFASASDIAMGGSAQGHIAIGDIAKGAYAWENMNQLTSADWAQIKETILREFPNIQKWILNIFT